MAGVKALNGTLKGLEFMRSPGGVIFRIKGQHHPLFAAKSNQRDALISLVG
jgi:hypothetical protein